MRHSRILAATAAALIGAGILLAPPADAVSLTIDVECETGSTYDLTVAAGDVIIFDLTDDSCEGLIVDYFDVGSQEEFDALVSSVADVSGTGGSAVGDFASVTVTYTAGPNSGRDSLIIDPRLRMAHRILPPGVSYFMTVPGGGAGPVPWLQEVGRQQGQTCAVGWNPSWGQWMNSGAGGFTCVREYYYDSSTGAWAYRKG